MSVQKFKISKKECSFTTIPNKVLQGLAGKLDALGLYCYLVSLPEGWEFYKSYLQSTCNVGVNKLDKLLKILSNHGLVTIAQVRNAQGHFAHFSMDVNDGTSFINNDLDESAHRSMKTVPPLTVPRITATINNTYTNKINNKEKLSCASVDARDLLFEEFWNIYPKKKDKSRAKEKFKKIPIDKIPLILEKIKLQIALESQWKDKQFIPLPSTYLHGKRWEDEIIEIKNKTEGYTKKLINNNDIRCTVKEYGTGHPTFEANKEWELKHGKQTNEFNIAADKSRRNGMRKAEDCLSF